jgi:hypothetical protein
LQTYIQDLFKTDGSQLGSAERRALTAAKETQQAIKKLNDQYTRLTQQVEQTKQMLAANQGALEANINLLVEMEKERRENATELKDHAVDESELTKQEPAPAA